MLANRRSGNVFSTSVTNKLLTAIDGAGGKPHGILWVIAVNAPDNLDPAALRGGRFTEKIWFDYPDLSTIEKIVAQWLSKSTAKFDPTLSSHVLAEILEGESPANIHAILQQAVNQMIARAIGDAAEQAVNRHDINDAMNIVGTKA